MNPSTGVRVPKPDIERNVELAVQQHGRPLATTLDFQDFSICEIDGDLNAASAAVCSVDPGADTHDVRRLLLAEVRVAVFHISSFA